MAPAAMPEGASADAWRSAGKHQGRCVRFPHAVDKASTDHCFEFLARETSPHA